MAKAKKLPSGSWRARPFVGLDENGKRMYKSFTADTKKEAEYMAAEYLMNNKEVDKVENMTLKDAIKKYIASKNNILSPSTIRGYNSICNHRLQDIMPIKIGNLTKDMIQEAMNKEAATHKAKTVKNTHGLLSAVLKEYRPSLNLTTSLPQREKKEMYIPTTEDINAVLSYTDGTELHLAILLAACLGLRRSEISALTWEDIDFDNKILSISKAVVLDSNKELITKSAKSFSGNRKLPIPDMVINELEKQRKPCGNVSLATPNHISNRFDKLLKRKGIPHFRFHDLRHYNASIMLSLNIPDKYAMKLMGHATSHMLKNVYQHTIKSKEEEVSNSINDYFNLSMHHEMHHDD